MLTMKTPLTTMKQGLYEEDWRNYNTPRWSEAEGIPITLYKTSPETYPTLAYPIITHIIDALNLTPEPLENKGHTNYLAETLAEPPPPSIIPDKNDKVTGLSPCMNRMTLKRQRDVEEEEDEMKQAKHFITEGELHGNERTQKLGTSKKKTKTKSNSTQESTKPNEDGTGSGGRPTTTTWVQ